MNPLVSWREEQQSAWLYLRIAEVERGTPRERLFQRLAAAAEEQSRYWAARAAEQGNPVPANFAPGRRARLVAWLLRRLGVRAIKPALAALKVRGLSVYSSTAAAAAHGPVTTAGDLAAHHKGIAHGGNLRAAVFGANDGLVSNASLILGVAGASGDTKVIALSGIAGLLAGAFSMAAGEYVSVRSQRELLEFQLGLEKDELERYPDDEAEELALIYEARGIARERALEFARDIVRDPAVALDTLAREELGLDPSALGSPWGAAVASFLAFAVGAALPLAPLLLAPPAYALAAAMAITAAALFGIGATLSLFTGRGALRGGLRMLAIGAAAGAATYGIGSLLGVSVA